MYARYFSYPSSSLVSQNMQILNCDYTIHPQWLLDKPSANPANWYSNDISESFSVNLAPEHHFDLESGSGFAKDESHVCTEDLVTDDSGWTDKEKNLLSRGIEIFGKSNVRLAQFIGSRSPGEVRHYLKHFYSDVQLAYDLSDDMVETQCVVQESLENVGVGVLGENEVSRLLTLLLMFDELTYFLACDCPFKVLASVLVF